MFSSFAQNSNYEKWAAMADNDISLQPEYGNFEKNELQKADDESFKKDILKYYKGDTNAASKKMSDLGFTYLYDKGDLVTAMRRFNQAYILNSKNADAYYGFGTIFFNLAAMEKAREQFDKGLEIDPKHSKILTDYGTTYLGDYYESLENEKENSTEFLTKANEYLEKSLEFDKKDSNTIYKLSIVKMYIGDCKEAKELLKKAKKMNNPNVTESYEKELNQKCK
jgi:Tfp pilus assembly protein PilF